MYSLRASVKTPDQIWDRGYCRSADGELQHFTPHDLRQVYFPHLDPRTDFQTPFLIGLNPSLPLFKVCAKITAVAEVYSDREEDCGRFLGHLRLADSPGEDFQIGVPHLRHLTHNSRGDLHFWYPLKREVHVFPLRERGAGGRPLFDPAEIRPLASTAELAVCCGSDDHLWQVSSAGNFYHYAPDCSLVEKFSVKGCTIKGNFTVDEEWNITYQNGNRRYLAKRNSGRTSFG